MDHQKPAGMESKGEGAGWGLPAASTSIWGAVVEWQRFGGVSLCTCATMHAGGRAHATFERATGYGTHNMLQHRTV